MSPVRIALGGLLVIASAVSLRAAEAPPENPGSDWFLRALSLPDSLLFEYKESKRAIRIAIVDDGFRLTHRDLQGRLWTNPGEIPGNGRDDDGNGFIDDVRGWDVSDGDNDVTPPPDRLKEFYHGTRNAGIIARIAGGLLPPGRGIEIIPVKCLSDQAGKTYLKDAYQGIAYAIRAGADIINCSWGGGPLGASETAVLREAEAKGILIVASAGNFFTEKPQFPAAFPGVIAVAALDSNGRKTAKSNYGSHIAISAPGEDVRSPSASGDTAYDSYEGTSAAVPMVSTVLALGMLARPGASRPELAGLMKNGADNIDALNPRFVGKLGAGRLNASRFLRADRDAAAPGAPTLVNPQGAVLFRKDAEGLFSSWFGKRAAAPVEWRIRSAGDVSGFRFSLSSPLREGGALTLTPADPQSAVPAVTLRPDSLGKDVFIPGNAVDVRFRPDHPRRAQRWVLGYEAVTLDSSRLYCRDLKRLDVAEGSFEDGSGTASYAWNSDCKWLITAPPGRVVELSFTEFDTEPAGDLVYAFDGAGTQATIVGIFSGPNPPPTVYSTGNAMLVWFVTNESGQGRGWAATYRFVAPGEAKPSRRRKN